MMLLLVAGCGFYSDWNLFSTTIIKWNDKNKKETNNGSHCNLSRKYLNIFEIRMLNDYHDDDNNVRPLPSIFFKLNLKMILNLTIQIEMRNSSINNYY